jgi:hypothetical protein
MISGKVFSSKGHRARRGKQKIDREAGSCSGPVEETAWVVMPPVLRPLIVASGRPGINPLFPAALVPNRPFRLIGRPEGLQEKRANIAHARVNMLAALGNVGGFAQMKRLVLLLTVFGLLFVTAVPGASAKGNKHRRNHETTRRNDDTTESNCPPGNLQNNGQGSGQNNLQNNGGLSAPPPPAILTPPPCGGLPALPPPPAPPAGGLPAPPGGSLPGGNLGLDTILGHVTGRMPAPPAFP